MLTTYLTAVFTATVSMIVITCFWVTVQRLWRSQFPTQESGDDDALANRSGCHGCNCAPSNCQREKNTRNETTTLNEKTREVS
jgi:hypothetical protein